MRSIFKREDPKQLESELTKKKAAELEILKDTFSSDEKKKLREELIALMIPIIKCKALPDIRNGEWASLVYKGRHNIEDVKAEYPWLGQEYIENIWELCFGRALSIAQTDLEIKEKYLPKELTKQEVFEDKYSFFNSKNGILINSVFSKSIPFILTIYGATLTILAGLSTAFPAFQIYKLYVVLFLQLGIFMLSVASFIALRLKSADGFKVILAITGFILFIAFIQMCIDQPQLIRYVQLAPTAPQPSAVVQPSSIPKPSTQAPPQNSQNISPRGNK